jgi:hypothetical protein
MRCPAFRSARLDHSGGPVADLRRLPGTANSATRRRHRIWWDSIVKRQEIHGNRDNRFAWASSQRGDRIMILIDLNMRCAESGTRIDPQKGRT